MKQTWLLNLGFIQTKSNYSLLFRENNKSIKYIIVCVDDIIIIHNNELEIHFLKIIWENNFKIKDLSRLSYFLVIEVSHSEESVFLSQRKYTQDILNESGLWGAKISKIPMERNMNMRNDVTKPIDNPTFYRTMIGKLDLTWVFKYNG